MRRTTTMTADELLDVRIHQEFRNTPTDESFGAFSRRRFLQLTAAGAGAGALALTFGEFGALAGTPLAPGEGVLVVLLLNGANDGLNTVAPIDDGAYRSARRVLALNQAEAHPVGNGMALHPNLRGLKSRFDRGDVAIIQGVGYPNSSLSHFDSMAYWHEGHANSKVGVRAETGWLGRYLDDRGAQRDLLDAVVFSSAIPLHLTGREGKAINLRSDGKLEFGVRADPDWQRVYNALEDMAPPGSPYGALADSLARVTNDSIDLAGRLAPAYVGETLTGDAVVRDMVQAARLINANVGIRVIGVEALGYDTHDGQTWRHGQLMSQLDAALEGFFNELLPQFAPQVTVMTASEFGRRPEINGAEGTDHGTASVAFVIGQRVKGGLYGEQPSMTNLDARGNLHPTVDFRSLYATVLGGWLGADDAEVLGANYEQFDLFGASPDAGTVVRGAPNPLAKHGYMIATAAGGVHNFGKHANFGSPWVNNIVAIRRHPTGDGYWAVGSDGGIFTFGVAGFFGSLGAVALNQPIVDMAPHPSGEGYWLCASDGGIFSFGAAQFHGSAGNIRLNKPAVAMAAHPSGNGYWLCASDGGIFTYGAAQFHGSAGNIRLNKPVVSMAADPSGNGYWLAASDGGVFTFGSASYKGSTGAIRLAEPVVDMSATSSGQGYWMVAADGGVFTFGDASYQGSLGGVPQTSPVVGIAP
ncbi:MAG: hypothetical protein ACI8Y4_003599 [Candidatus Poriferisodalaceae bacterium]|jgi:uncharacterized protein (DUF1501 family)